MKKILESIKTNFKTKSWGFYATLVPFVLMVGYLFSYMGIGSVDISIYNPAVITYAILGVVLFIVLTMFKETSKYAPIPLMIFSFLSLLGVVTAEGFIDYFTTQFFDGFSLPKLMALEFSVWFSLIAVILSFILSSICYYFPQNKKMKGDK